MIKSGRVLMVGNRRLSEDEVRQISLRMKSTRMLSGLTQENFAEEHNISLTSIKYWEMGRAVPRRDGVLSYVNALKKAGIEISPDWIFYGSGPGPIYMHGTQVEKQQPSSSYVELQIDLFKKQQLSKGLNPIVTSIRDDEMHPQFRKGDVVGGIYVTLPEIRSLFSLRDILRMPWLVMLNQTDFMPRFLVLSEIEEQVFFRSNQDPLIRSGPILTMGRICWHYSGVEQT